MSAFKTNCPVEDIAAYIDGELDAARSAEIEAHLTVCEDCKFESNRQKRLLCNITSGLRYDDGIVLPRDFAKTIAVNAESSVHGLRRPRELFNSVLVFAALALFAVFALGADVQNLLKPAYSIFDQTITVVAFFGHLAYSFFLGAAIVLRSFVPKIDVEIFTAVILTCLLILAVVNGRRIFLRRLRV